MSKGKERSVAGVVVTTILVVLAAVAFMFLFSTANEAGASVKKLTSLMLYVGQDSKEASTVSSFDDGGFPGLSLSASKVIVGDSLYVGDMANHSRVLTEEDLELVRQEIYKQIYSELRENACLK